MRDGVLNHPPFGKTDETMASKESDDSSAQGDSDDFEAEEDLDEDIDDHTVVLLEPSPENDNFDSNGEEKSGKLKSRLQRWLSRIEVSHRNDPMGAWYEAHRRIATEKHHSEL